MTPTPPKNTALYGCWKDGAFGGLLTWECAFLQLLTPLLALILLCMTGCLSSDDGKVDENKELPPTHAGARHEPDSQAPVSQKSEAELSAQGDERTESGTDESFTPSDAIIGGIKKLNPLQLIDKIDDTLRGIQPKDSPDVSARELAGLQSRVRSLEQELLDLRSELSVLKRSFRSGLLTPIDIESDADLREIDMPQPSSERKPTEPGGTDKPIERVNSKTTPLGSHQDLALHTALAEGPFELLERASASIERSDYGAAVVLLQALQTKFPGYRDEGLGDILLGESWLALKSPDRAVQPLTRTIGLHPTGSHMPRAKLALARAYNDLGEKQRSIRLLLDVIALAPSTPIADMARAQLALQGEAR